MSAGLLVTFTNGSTRHVPGATGHQLTADERSVLFTGEDQSLLWACSASRVDSIEPAEAQ